MRLSDEVHRQAAEYLIKYRSMRVGQAYWNAAFASGVLTWSSGHAWEDESLTASTFDPYHDNNNLERFLSYLYYQLGEYDV